MDRYKTLLQAPKGVLVTHAVLLLRTVNRHESKEKQMDTYACYLSKEELANYIVHFHDEEPDPIWDEEVAAAEDDVFYSPSATARDYGPCNPWDAPGMSVCDFI